MTAILLDEVLDEEALACLLEDVFTGLLGELAEPPHPTAHTDVELPVAAHVAVRGGWHAEIVFACTGPTALDLAQRLFVLPAAAVTDADLRDVVGEIANVIGGNLKSLMPGPSALSLPVATFDSAPGTTYPVEALRVDLLWDGRPMRITVLVPSPTPEQNR